MTWEDLGAPIFEPNTKLLSEQMRFLRDNIAAAFAKDSGAPVLANDYVVAAMIANDSVTTNKILNGCITTAKLANYSITTDKILAANVTGEKLANNSVATEHLHTSEASVSNHDTSTGANLIITGQYAHHGRFDCGGLFYARMANGLESVANRYNIWIHIITHECTYTYIYHTSSGEVYWIFYLVERGTHNIMASSYAPDHVSMGTGKPDLIQHPFADVLSDSTGLYIVNNDIRKDVDIIVINPSREEVDHCRAKQDVDDPLQFNRSFAEVFRSEFEFTTTNLQQTKWPDIPITVGLKNNHDWSDKKPTELIKRIVDRPKHVILGRAILKSKSTDGKIITI